jgi:hypothetical protein
MNYIEEKLPLLTHIKKTTKTMDGWALILICMASFLCILDIIFNTGFIPLRDSDEPSKALLLLLFSPFLIFLILVRLRQFPFSEYYFASFIRAILCIFAFLLINF